MSSIDITVFIPTYYGEQYLDELLKAVFAQEIDKTFEVLVYDTSSKDNTPKIIEKFTKKYNNLRYKTIKKEEFGHGLVRQQAAEDAQGDIVVYLSQDATPINKSWLYEITKPFELNERVAGVVGKQVARPKAFPLLKREIRSVFSGLGPDTGTALYYKDDFIISQQQFDHAAFYSDVNSAARKSVLLDEVPYKPVAYAEDQLFGRDLITAGFVKAYASRGAVLHSNEFPLREYKHRMFDEVMGLRRVGIPVERPSIKATVKLVLLGSIKDFVFTLRDREYSLKRKLFYILANPLYHIEKWRGVRLAAKTDIEDNEAIGKYSLEALQHKRK